MQNTRAGQVRKNVIRYLAILLDWAKETKIGLCNMAKEAESLAKRWERWGKSGENVTEVYPREILIQLLLS